MKPLTPLASLSSLLLASAALLILPLHVTAQASAGDAAPQPVNKPHVPIAAYPAVVTEGKILGVKKIWSEGEHNAFTDLIRFQNRWLCTFREGGNHKSPNGDVRVIESDDGEHWKSAALLKEEGIDLRDPKFCLTPDGRLMLIIGGSEMKDGLYVTRQPRVSFSRDGRTWTATRRVGPERQWFWRVTWFKGQAYTISYLGGGGLKDKRDGFLFTSSDGVDWKLIKKLDLPSASETTVRFMDDGEMIALSRAEPGKGVRLAKIGSSRPPYTEWTWKDVPVALGGPNFIVLPDGRWLAGTRERPVEKNEPQTALAWMTRDSFKSFLKFESGGDNSYPGLVWYNDVLWVSYYSSHQGKTDIYLAKVQLPKAK